MWSQKGPPHYEFEQILLRVLEEDRRIAKSPRHGQITVYERKAKTSQSDLSAKVQAAEKAAELRKRAED